MGFLDRIKRILQPPHPAGRYYQFRVKCKRCGEILEGRLDRYNDPSVEYEGDKEVNYCRKVLVGSGPCYQAVEVTFKFDESRNKILEQQVIGGEFLELAQ